MFKSPQVKAMFGGVLARLRRRSAANEAGAVSATAEAPKRLDPERILRRLEWTVIRRLDGLLQGDYRTLFRGFGIDLADLREYQAHDDVRYIDWNVTARLQVPHVREFQEDREVSAWFLLDLSGSVDFGSAEVTKRTLSAEFVTVLARLLTRYGNRVGAVLYSNGTDAVIPARIGRRHVLHLLDRMLRPAAAATPAPGKQTDLSELLKKAQQVIKRRSVVFVVSDFISTPGWERALALLARRHEVVAVRLYDPMEQALPELGLMVMQDAETGEQLFVDMHDGGFRRRFAKLAAEREQNLRTALAEAGVDCLELATDDDVAAALLRFTRLRKRRSQLAAGAGSAATRAGV
ncbi:MAG: DUF58 domain-containing protein [Betaproteobacteria bacterium]